MSNASTNKEFVLMTDWLESTFNIQRSTMESSASESACKYENNLSTRLSYLEGTIKSLTSRLDEIVGSIQKTQDAVSEHDSKMTKITERLKKYKTSAKVRKQKIDGLEAKLLEYSSKQFMESRRIQNVEGSAANPNPLVKLNRIEARNNNISSRIRDTPSSSSCMLPKETAKKDNQTVSQRRSSCHIISKKKRRLNFQILAASEKHYSSLGYQDQGLPSNVNTANSFPPTFTVTTESSNLQDAIISNSNKTDDAHSDIYEYSKPTGKKSKFSARFPGFQLRNFFVVCEQLNLSDHSSTASSLQGGSTPRENGSDLDPDPAEPSVARPSSEVSLDSYNSVVGQTPHVCDPGGDSISEEISNSEINNTIARSESSEEMPMPRRKAGQRAQVFCKFCNRSFSHHRSVIIDSHIVEVAHNHRQELKTVSTSQSTLKKLNSYCCDYCSEHFKSKFNLDEHVMSHSAERPFACSAPKCSESFKRKCNLLEHLKSHSSMSLSEFPCTKCGEIFKRNHELQRHVSEVHKKDSHYWFDCCICHKTVKYTYNLTKHLSQHEKNQD